MSQKFTLSFTADGAQSHDCGTESNVIIEGGFGGGTVTHTMTGTTTAIRTGSTAAASYLCEIYDSTFTVTGSTAPTITVTIEPKLK